MIHEYEPILKELTTAAWERAKRGEPSVMVRFKGKPSIRITSWHESPSGVTWKQFFRNEGIVGKINVERLDGMYPVLGLLALEKTQKIRDDEPVVHVAFGDRITQAPGRINRASFAFPTTSYDADMLNSIAGELLGQPDYAEFTYEGLAGSYWQPAAPVSSEMEA